MFRWQTAHTVEVLVLTQVSLSTFMVWAVHILHTWALWAGSVNLVTAQEFCLVYYFIWAYTVMLHALTLTACSYALLQEGMVGSFGFAKCAGARSL